MNVTQREILEARLLLARATCEWYYDKSDYDFMDEIAQSNRELMLANDALVEYVVESNKTDLERLEERVAAAWVVVLAAEDRDYDATHNLSKAQRFYRKAYQELEDERAEDLT
tara:strand:- start:30 stop:368 length:339 start_codon:yes stop_codon:yes gene_type:complete